MIIINACIIALISFLIINESAIAGVKLYNFDYFLKKNAIEIHHAAQTNNDTNKELFNKIANHEALNQSFNKENVKNVLITNRQKYSAQKEEHSNFSDITQNTGTYLSVNTGLNMLMTGDADATLVSEDGSETFDGSFDVGFDINAALGVSLGKNVRVEAEIAYQTNDWDKSKSADTSSTVDGYFSSLRFMANAWYDFNTGTNWVPFLGGGAGFSLISMEYTAIDAEPAAFDESDTVFAYQVGAGIGYNLSKTATVSLSYRLFGTSEVELVSNEETQKYEYLSHIAMIGFRYKI